MQTLLLIICLIFASGAQAANDYKSRVREVENIAKKHPNFAQEHELLIEASSVCGAGDSYYIGKGKATAIELNRLRILLRFRFNGTTVQTVSGVHIDFENSTGVEVTTKEIETLLSDPEFLAWLGKDLAVPLTNMIAARSSLIAQSPIPLKNPEDFFSLDVFRNYSSITDIFYKRLAKKFRIIAIDNLVDCD